MSGFSRFRGRRQWRWSPPKNCGAFRGASPVIVLSPVMLLLAGCSLAPVIAESTLNYNTTVETVTNGVLVTNILRARDSAPLYFSDLSHPRRGASQFAGANHDALRANVSRGRGSLGLGRPARHQQSTRLRRRTAEHQKIRRRHAGRHRRKSLCVFHSAARRCQGGSQPRRQPRRALSQVR
jgi:hypothetical protein